MNEREKRIFDRDPEEYYFQCKENEKENLRKCDELEAEEEKRMLKNISPEARKILGL